MTRSDLRFKKSDLGDYPSGPVFKTVFSRAGVQGWGGSIPSWGTKIPHAASCDQKKKKKESFFSSIKGAQNFQPLKRKRSKSCNFHLAT